MRFSISNRLRVELNLLHHLGDLWPFLSEKELQAADELALVEPGRNQASSELGVHGEIFSDVGVRC